MNNNIEQPVVKRDSLKKSSFFNILIKVFAYIIPLILSPYLYRTLNVSGIGEYTFQYSYVSYFMLVAAFGFDSYGSKAITTATNSKEEMTKRFWSVYYAKLFLGTVCLIIYFSMVFSHVFGDSSSIVSYCVLSLFIVGTMTDVTFLFTGIEKFQSISLRTLFIKLVNLVLIFIFVHKETDFLAYVIIMSASFLLSSLAMYFPLHKYIGKPVFHGLNIWEDIKGASFFLIPSLAVTAYSTFGKTILGLFYDSTQVGYYESAVKVESVITSISYAVVPILLARNSYLIAIGRQKESDELISKGFNALMDLALPACVGVFCISDVFVPLFFGSADAQAIPMLKIACFAIPFVVISGIVNYAYLIPRGKLKQVNIIPLIVCAFSFVCNLLTIRFIGPNGAAISLLFTEILSAVIFFFCSRKDINYRVILKKIIKPFDSALIMGIFYFLANKILTMFFSVNVSMVICIILCAILYGVLLILFKDDFCYQYYKNIKFKIIARKQK